MESPVEQWKSLSNPKRIMVGASGVILLIALGWIIFLLRPADTHIEMPTQLQTELSAAAADEEALRAMTYDALRAEVATREAAFKLVDSGSDPEARRVAEEALERAREIMLAKRPQPNTPP